MKAACGEGGLPDVEVKVGVEGEPGVGGVVALGLEAIADADAGDGPIADGIDAGELGKIEDGELGGGLETVYLEDFRGVGAGFGDGEIDVRLDDVAEIIEAPGAGFDLGVLPGELKGALEAAIDDAARGRRGS